MKLKNIQLFCQFSLLLLMLSTVVACNQNNDDSDSNKKEAAKTTGKGDRLNLIKSRGKLICGINDSLPGFSYQEEDGSYSGISVDICRALAVALFDDLRLFVEVNKNIFSNYVRLA